MTGRQDRIISFLVPSFHAFTTHYDEDIILGGTFSRVVITIYSLEGSIVKEAENNLRRYSALRKLIKMSHKYRGPDYLYSLTIEWELSSEPDIIYEVRSCQNAEWNAKWHIPCLQPHISEVELTDNTSIHPTTVKRISMIPTIKHIYADVDKGTIVVKWDNGEKTKVKLKDGDAWDLEAGVNAAVVKYICTVPHSSYQRFITTHTTYVQHKKAKKKK